MGKKLTIKKKGEKDVLFEQDVFDNSIVSVGNNPTATLELIDNEIAPEQFVLISENEQNLLMNRALGTSVNGEKLDLGGQVSLVEGDKIEIGDYILVFNSAVQNGNVQGKTVELKQNDEVLDEVEEEFIESDKEIIEEEPIVDIKPKSKDFSDVLSNIKKDESFYFQIRNDKGIFEKVNFDDEEIWVGVSFDECTVKNNNENLDEVYAQVKKDWSGAVIYPTGTEKLFLNEEELLEPARLKNDDEIVLFDSFEEEKYSSQITFHEPIALLVLNSILPEELPEPISVDSKQQNQNGADNLVKNTDELENQTKSKENQTKSPKRKSRVLGYFTAIELLIMTFGTLVTAVIIFFLLELI